MRIAVRRLSWSSIRRPEMPIEVLSRWIFVAALVFLFVAPPMAASADFSTLSLSTNRSYVFLDESSLKSAGALDLSQYASITTGSFAGIPSGQDPVKIYYRYFENKNETKGGIVIVSGRTEATTVYEETIHDLLRNGYSVYVHDHRGQGFSSRLLPASDDQSKGYIDDFDNYVADLAKFMELVGARREGNSLPTFILAHSMGGAIATLYLEGSGNRRPRGAALVTPMFAPWATGESKARLNKAAQFYCDRLSTRFPFPLPSVSARYIDGTSFDTMYASYLVAKDGSKSELTSSSVRLARNWEARRATCTGADCGSPDARIGGSTVRWFNQACVASRSARGVAASKVSVPVLLFQGELDTIVNPSAQVDFCNHANANRELPICSGYVVPGSKHAALIESDGIRIAVLSKILDYFACLSRDTASCR